MNTIYFDIETAPLPEIMVQHLIPKFEAPANFKDPDKIAAALTDKKTAWLDKLALSPLTGTVAAIGCLSGESGVVSIDLAADSSEKSLLEAFWGQYRAFSESARFAGFNIFRFDLPFLVKRSLQLGVPLPLRLRSGRWWGDPFVDLMEIWQLGDRQEFISLDMLARFLGVGEKTGTGKDFFKLDSKSQLAYLEQDLVLTKKIGEKLLAI